MAISPQGRTGAQVEVGSTHAAVRVEARPLEGATFRLGATSGTIGAGLGGGQQIFFFHNYDATRLVLLHSLRFDMGVGTAFTPGLGNFICRVRRGTTVITPSTAAEVSPGGHGNKMRTAMEASRARAFIANTGAMTAAAGGVADTQGVSNLPIAFDGRANAQYVYGHEFLIPGHPLVLAENEDLEIGAIVPATGTWQFGVSLMWSEVERY